MKAIPFYDIVFIIVCALFFLVVDHFGYSRSISQFPFIIALVAYFIGKYFGRIQSIDEQEKEDARKK